jgi:hypothetical protein
MNQQISRLIISIAASYFLISLYGCTKLVAIPPPLNSITTSQTFSTDQEATEAMNGVYYGMINNPGGLTSFRGGLTIYGGASSDEINFFLDNSEPNFEFQNNSLRADNTLIVQDFWAPMYSAIYGCNAVISGVSSSSLIHDSVRSELIGEAKLVRALSYFYLINLFGNVPLVTTIDYNKTSLLAKSQVDSIYNAIIADLIDAEARLAPDYSVGHGERIVPNRWAATALLARVYLYRSDWLGAEKEASAVLSNVALYSLVLNPDSVFLANSNEAIWQLQQSNQIYPFNATEEGNYFVPSAGSQPNAYISATLMNAFSNSDLRRIMWLDSVSYAGSTYYIPYKYRMGPDQFAQNGVDSAYYVVLRLGEQYLIRAEAEAHGAGGGINSAIIDLNMIRNRAMVTPYSGPPTQDSVLNAIYHERQLELFAEWGNRWLDLKRWGNATQVLTQNKGITVSPNSLLFPLPNAELVSDPNLTQNPGYK